MFTGGTRKSTGGTKKSTGGSRKNTSGGSMKSTAGLFSGQKIGQNSNFSVITAQKSIIF